MLKKQTANDNQDKFSLIGMGTGLFYTEVSVDFKAPFNLNKSSNSIVPTFYRDGCFYNSAFILPRQKENYEKNKKFEKIIFEEKINKANSIWLDSLSQMKSELSLTVPEPDTNYCQICKRIFNSYFSHIQQNEHIKESEKSEANNYISQLMSKYKQKKVCFKNGYKKKQIKKGRQKKLAIRNKTFSIIIRAKSEIYKTQSLKCINNTDTSSQITIYF